MEEKNSKFSNGFIWGIALGGALVFLLGTKKGKKILQSFTSTGLDILEGLTSANQGEYIDEEPVAEKSDKTSVEFSQESNSASNNHSSPKRFFRGVKK